MALRTVIEERGVSAALDAAELDVVDAYERLVFRLAQQPERGVPFGRAGMRLATAVTPTAGLYVLYSFDSDSVSVLKVLTELATRTAPSRFVSRSPRMSDAA